jgi:hypothetical protein
MYVLYVCLYVLIYKCYIFVCSFLLTNAVVKHVSNDVICCCNKYALRICTDRLKEECVVYHQMNPGNALNMNVACNVMILGV